MAYRAEVDYVMRINGSEGRTPQRTKQTDLRASTWLGALFNAGLKGDFIRLSPAALIPQSALLFCISMVAKISSRERLFAS